MIKFLISLEALLTIAVLYLWAVQ